MLILSAGGCATIDRSWYQDVYCTKTARYYTAMPYGKDYAVFEKQNDQTWSRSSEPFDTFEAANEAAKATAYETPASVFVRSRTSGK